MAERLEEIVTSFAPAMLDGRFDHLRSVFTAPVVLAIGGDYHVIDDLDELVDHIRVRRADILRLGAVRGRSRLLRPPMINRDIAYLDAEFIYWNAENDEVVLTITGYVLRKTGGDWKITIASFDDAMRITARKLFARRAVPELGDLGG